MTLGERGLMLVARREERVSSSKSPKAPRTFTFSLGPAEIISEEDYEKHLAEL